MPYKISGNKSETSRVIILKESDWSIESNTVISGVGVYEITELETGPKTIIARTINGNIISYGDVDSIYYPPMPSKAVSPTPNNGVADQDVDVDISWVNGGAAISYDVYFGTDPTPDASEFKGNQPELTYEPGTLEKDGTYYWRIDSKNETGTTTGDIWNFETEPLVILDRGVFGGGYTTGFSTTKNIDYITISTTGNAINFGNLTMSRTQLAACASSDRGIFAGALGSNNRIDYFTILTPGNASVFGELSVNRMGSAGCSNNTRGIFGGGYYSGYLNVIDYITIASTGNAVDFGNLNIATQLLAACASPTRGLFGGGVNSSATNLNTISYITISTTGNTTDFGDLTLARSTLSACSSDTRGIFAGGSSTTDRIDYITIATTANAIDFGNLTLGKYRLAACSSQTRGVFSGGAFTGSSDMRTDIDYITIATTGNATDFGDLTAAKCYHAGTSDCHGGL